jgi:hypothetical protein
MTEDEMITLLRGLSGYRGCAPQVVDPVALELIARHIESQSSLMARMCSQQHSVEHLVEWATDQMPSGRKVVIEISRGKTLISTMPFSVRHELPSGWGISEALHCSIESAVMESIEKGDLAV